ncbi:MAG TPA: MFS transporter [Candidatus Eremiobacteraceae bacterium]|nr:MFS transporter [Candidatus Eremiobacteraceae bacterium]
MSSVTEMIAARLDALPSSRALYGLVGRISAGAWFEGYDLFMLAYISLGMIRSGVYTATGSGFGSIPAFAAAGFLGMFAGALLFGSISDRFGRRSAFLWSLVWYSVATVTMSIAGGPFAIDGFRFLAGLGIGVQLVTVDAYISEIVPPSVRGRAIALSQTITFTAVPAAAFIAQALVPHAYFGFDGWRLVALAGGLGAVFVAPWFRSLPESPRWLAARGRHVQAVGALLRIETIVGAGSDAASIELAESSPIARASWTEMWDERYRARSAMLVIFNFFQTIGFYGFASWVPILVFAEGVSFVHSLLYTALIALAAPLGPALAAFVGERWERKWQIVGLAAASAFLGLALAVTRAPAGIICAGIGVTLANNWFSSAFHAYQAELYPTRIRARAVGFVYSWSRLSAVFVGFWIADILARYGPGGAFAFIAAGMAIAAGVIAAAGPLSRGRRLESLAP